MECTEDIDRIEVVNKGTFPIKLKNQEEKEMEFDLPNMTILECYKGESVSCKFAVSNELIQKTHNPCNKRYDVGRFYFYLEAREDYVRIGDSIIVLKKDVPKELTTQLN